MGIDDELKKKLARLGHKYALEYEMVRASAAFEHAALRPLFLLNGGALVAYFTLYGALRSAGFDRVFVIGAAVTWLVGLIIAAIATYFGAISQFAFRKLRGTEVELEEQKLGLSVEPTEAALHRSIGKYQNQGRTRRIVSVTLGFVSLGAFVLAMGFAFLSLPHIKG